MLRAVHNVGVGAAKKFVFGVEIYLFVADIEERQYLVAVLDAGYDVCLPVVGGHYLGERAAKSAVPQCGMLFFECIELGVKIGERIVFPIDVDFFKERLSALECRFLSRDHFEF